MSRLAVDLDGVLADFTSALRDILISNYGVSLPRNYQPTDWYWVNAGISKEQLEGAWAIILKDPHFWEQLYPLKGIVPMSEFFHNSPPHIDIYFLTSRVDTAGQTAKAQSEMWLRRHLGNPKREISVIVVKSSDQKEYVLRALDIKFFVDDYPMTVLKTNEIEGCNSYLLNQPWNNNECVKNIRRIDSLYEVFREIRNN